MEASWGGSEGGFEVGTEDEGAAVEEDRYEGVVGIAAIGPGLGEDVLPVAGGDLGRGEDAAVEGEARLVRADVQRAHGAGRAERAERAPGEHDLRVLERRVAVLVRGQARRRQPGRVVAADEDRAAARGATAAGMLAVDRPGRRTDMDVGAAVVAAAGVARAAPRVDGVEEDGKDSSVRFSQVFPVR